MSNMSDIGGFRRVQVTWGNRKVPNLGDGESPRLQEQYVEPVVKDMAEKENLSQQAVMCILAQTIASMSAGEITSYAMLGENDAALEAAIEWYEVLLTQINMLAAVLNTSPREVIRSLRELLKEAQS